MTHEAKKALAGQLPGIGRSMCVEISLKTSEVESRSQDLSKGLSLVLEAFLLCHVSILMLSSLDDVFDYNAKP